MVIVGVLISILIEFYRYKRNQDKHWLRWVTKHSRNEGLREHLLDGDATPESSRKVHAHLARSPSLGRPGRQALAAPDGSGNVIFRLIKAISPRKQAQAAAGTGSIN